MASSPNAAAAPAPTDPKRTVHRGYDMQFHGTAAFRGADCPNSDYYEQGRFGRLFPLLPRFNPDPSKLMQLGAAGGPMDGTVDNPDHPGGLPAGFTFLGQFVDHDMTFDPTSSLERQVDPEAIQNFRTPLLELDNVYGSGPGANPHLYRSDDRDKLLIDRDVDSQNAAARENDLPRNSQGTALLGDPRNDENLMVSQLHVAFLRFHNAVVDHVRLNLPAGRSVFEEAQRLVRWHYQWMLLHDFLPRIVGQPMVDAVLKKVPRFYKWRNEPYIPVEFAVAAYRFGHSQVRPGYRVSTDFARPLFPTPPVPGAPAPAPPPPDPRPDLAPLPGDLTGGRRIRPEQVIEWKRFFPLDPANPPQPGKKFDTRISPPLMHLPFAKGTAEDPASLAQRNLMRSRTFRLPSGQDVARAMKKKHDADADDTPNLPKIEVLTPTELADQHDIGFDEHTPLWFYILREADLRAGGQTLGPVGGRIVAEVIVGVIQGDPLSYLGTDPSWTPFLGAGGQFTMADLLHVAGVDQSPAAGPPANTVWTA